MSAQGERRWRFYVVDAEDVWSLFAARASSPTYLYVIQGAPEGAFVRDVHYSPHHRGFLFRLEHPSFDPVPDGCETPVCGMLLWEAVRVRLDDGPDVLPDVMIGGAP